MKYRRTRPSERLGDPYKPLKLGYENAAGRRYNPPKYSRISGRPKGGGYSSRPGYNVNPSAGYSAYRARLSGEDEHVYHPVPRPDRPSGPTRERPSDYRVQRSEPIEHKTDIEQMFEELKRTRDPELLDALMKRLGEEFTEQTKRIDVGELTEDEAQKIRREIEEPGLVANETTTNLKESEGDSADKRQVELEQANENIPNEERTEKPHRSSQEILEATKDINPEFLPPEEAEALYQEIANAVMYEMGVLPWHKPETPADPSPEMQAEETKPMEAEPLQTETASSPIGAAETHQTPVAEVLEQLEGKLDHIAADMAERDTNSLSDLLGDLSGAEDAMNQAMESIEPKETLEKAELEPYAESEEH